MPRGSSSVESWVERFRRFLVRRRYSRFALKQYRIAARDFLRFLEARGVDPAAARPSHVRSYLKVQLVRRRRRLQREPHDQVDWRSHHTAPIHLFLRMAQGAWPPPSVNGARLASFRTCLRRKHFTPHAVSAYCVVAHRFLKFLVRRAVAVERVQPVDLAAYIADERRRYCRRHGRDPKDVIVWRCSLAGAVHALLRQTQGRWPPPPTHPWFERFRAHMAETCSHRMTREHYVFTAGRFLAFLEAQKIPVEAVEPSHVEAYRWIKLAEYRQRYGRPPTPLSRWRWSVTIPIHRLLRLVHGHWPPLPPLHPELERLHNQLLVEQYRPGSRYDIERVVRHFLDHLRREGVRPKQVQPAHVESYLRGELARYRRRYGHAPPKMATWRAGYTRAIGRLLCSVQGCWPPVPPPPATPRERFCRELRDGFRRWMIELRGLSPLTFDKDWGTAEYFLQWLKDRASPAGLRRLTAPDLDGFLAWRMAGLRRATRSGVCQGLRVFLRYLHGAGYLDRDLTTCVSTPSRYHNESIPSTFTAREVETMLAEARANRSPVGRRDYAILLLLATYGLRAGEIVRLRLEDIDWRRERFQITQSKTRRTSQLPLLPAVGEAILDYLRHGRPASDQRAVFLRQRAPYTPFKSGSCLSAVVWRHVRRCELQPAGRHGAHAFRYARAVSLLRAAVPLKAISDLLGHSSSASTEIYLKLATDDLRDVGLELPQEVAP